MRRVIQRTVTTIKIVSVTITSGDETAETQTTTTDEQTVLVEGDSFPADDDDVVLEIEPPVSNEDDTDA